MDRHDGNIIGKISRGYDVSYDWLDMMGYLFVYYVNNNNKYAFKDVSFRLASK